MKQLIKFFTVYFRCWLMAAVILFIIMAPIACLTAMSFKHLNLLEWNELSRGVLFVGAFFLAILRMSDTQSEWEVTQGVCLKCKAENTEVVTFGTLEQAKEMQKVCHESGKVERSQ